jgi:hypothetical protein
VSVHVFVDESKSKGFLLAATYVPCGSVSRLRAEVAGLHLPEQVRIHFTSESPKRRKQILAALIAAGDISTIIYDATAYEADGKAGRDAAIAQMAASAAQIPAARLVLERDDSVVDQDRQMIKAQLIAAGVVSQVGYDHLRAREEPLLAIPDAVAWCWAKGGEWRKLADPLVQDVVLLLATRDSAKPGPPTVRKAAGLTSPCYRAVQVHDVCKSRPMSTECWPARLRWADRQPARPA